MAELSITQIVIVLVIALLVFGPKRLPELGRQIGKGLRELRSHATSMGHELSQAVDDTPDPGWRGTAGPSAPAAGAAPHDEPSADEDDELLAGVVVRSDGASAPTAPPAPSDDVDELLEGVVVSGATAPDRRSR